MAAHNQLEQVLGGGLEQLAHAEVVDDEQVRAGQLGEVVLAGVGERRLGEFFEEGVRSRWRRGSLLDRGALDRLGKMTLARTGLADQEDVLALCDEACGGELEDECALIFFVEGVRARPPAPGTATVATPCTARRTRAAERRTPPEDARYCEREEHAAVQADQREPLGIPDGPAERSTAAPRRSVAGSPALPARHDAAALEERGSRAPSACGRPRRQGSEQEREKRIDTNRLRATSSPRRSRTRSKVAATPCGAVGCGRMRTATPSTCSSSLRSPTAVAATSSACSGVGGARHLRVRNRDTTRRHRAGRRLRADVTGAPDGHLRQFSDVERRHTGHHDGDQRPPRRHHDPGRLRPFPGRLRCRRSSPGRRTPSAR